MGTNFILLFFLIKGKKEKAKEEEITWEESRKWNQPTNQTSCKPLPKVLSLIIFSIFQIGSLLSPSLTIKKTFLIYNDMDSSSKTHFLLSLLIFKNTINRGISYIFFFIFFFPEGKTKVVLFINLILLLHNQNKFELLFLGRVDQKLACVPID